MLEFCEEAEKREKELEAKTVMVNCPLGHTVHHYSC